MLKQTRKECFYCGANLAFSNYEYYLIRKAIKPKGNPHRWKTVGFCCDNCYNKGHRVKINER